VIAKASGTLTGVSVLILVVAAIFLLAVGCGMALVVSVRRQGGFASKLIGKLFGNRLGRALAARASKHLLSDEDSLSMEHVHQLMASNPELIEKMAADQGLDPEQARAALATFSGLDKGAQRDIITRAQTAAAAGATTPEEIAAAVGPLPTHGRGNAAARAAKRKAAARARKTQRQKRH
jgi:hypothetical protein